MVDQASGGDDEQDFPSTLPGTVIAGKYRLDGMIGRGGMGSVWSTMHLGLGQRVAVKLIAKRYAGSREARQRFDLEAKAVAQLRSRYVVQVFDNGETEDGTPYIVMELLDGESLDHRIDRRGPVPLDQTVRIISQVGKALNKAHGLGIVHRDLKPENVFLARSDEDDAGEIAKVLDFGIAKIKTTDTGGSATRTGTVLGTPLFMSPEQARGLKSVDHRTDIYSLGMVAFTMLTGRTAFSGESFGDILVAICTQPLPSLRTYAPMLPASVDAWMQRACAKEPGERFAGVEQMVDAFYVAAGITRPRSPNAATGPVNEPSHARIPNEGGGSRVAVSPTHIMTQASSGGISDQHSSGGISGQRQPPNVPDRRTTAAVSVTGDELAVTGDDIPKRSLALPAIIGFAALALGGVGAFVVLGRSAESSQPSKGEAGAPTLVASVATPTASVSSGSVTPPPKASAEASKVDDSPASTAAKAMATAKPAPAPPPASPQPAKPAPQPAPLPAPRPSNPRPKTPDLGF
jgi:serine/threonine protein kinase